MLNHPNIIRHYFKWEIVGNTHNRVLVIVTDLELDAENPGFDSSTFDDVVNLAVEESKRLQATVDRVDILPA